MLRRAFFGRELTSMVNFNPRSCRGAVVALIVLFSGWCELTPLHAAGDAASSATLRPQTIRFDSLQDRTIDGSLLPLIATATSGLKVHFTVVSGPAQIVGSQLMIAGPGEVVIRATQPGDATHAAAAAVERSFKALAPSAEQNNANSSVANEAAPAASPAPEPAQSAAEPPANPVPAASAAVADLNTVAADPDVLQDEQP